MANQISDLEELRRLLSTPEPPELGPGPRPGVHLEAALEHTVNRVLGRSGALSSNRRLAHALLLLWHDYLEAAHTIAQRIETPDGAFVHGIMHRREPDYGNAKYWFHRVGDHPSFEEIAGRVAALPQISQCRHVARRLVQGARWDAFAMVDACEAAAGGASSEPQVTFLREVQRVETEVLLARFVSL